MKSSEWILLKPTTLEFTLLWHPGNTIVSPDKDMRQIPGNLYDLNEVTVVTPEEGYHWHMVQTLAGDQTDGYGGVPGIGVKRAISLFETHGYTWKQFFQRLKRRILMKMSPSKTPALPRSYH